MSTIKAGDRLASQASNEYQSPKLYEIFHENTKLNSHKLKIFQSHVGKHISNPDFKESSLENNKCYPTLKRIKLNISKLPALNIQSCILNRKSVRNFTSDPMQYNELSNILYYSAGLNDHKKYKINFRNEPSAGALYPLEIYIVINRVNNIHTGIYHYNIRENCLELLKEVNDICNLVDDYHIKDQSITTANATLLVTAIFKRTTFKYGNRGYRFILTEVGHLLQNIALTSTTYGIGTCELGGYEDDEINHLLDIDGVYEAIVGEMAIGNFENKNNEMPNVL